ncbi:MAG: hypothetical protein IE917_15490 [Betaproteobacteria bacterium]|nr:hypothetical protein [Betaproteobacteria bacterium]
MQNRIEHLDDIINEAKALPAAVTAVVDAGERHVPVYCFALGGTFRALRMRQDKAPCAGNGHSLGKHGNAVMAHSEGSLRASRWPIICGVAPACKGVALAARARLASNRPAAR